MPSIPPPPTDSGQQARREAFVQAVEAQAFTVTDPEASDFGLRITHCFRGFIGADWDTESVVALIREADLVGWGPDLFGHNLRVVKDNKLYRFDVKDPALPASEVE